MRKRKRLGDPFDERVPAAAGDLRRARRSCPSAAARPTYQPACSASRPTRTRVRHGSTPRRCAADASGPTRRRARSGCRAQSVLQVRPPSRSRPSSSTVVRPRSAHSRAAVTPANPPPTITTSCISYSPAQPRQPRPRPGRAGPRAPGCTRPPPNHARPAAPPRSAASLAAAPRSTDSPPRPPSSSGAPRSERSARLDPRRVGRQRHDRDVVEQLGPDPAEREHQRGHDRIGADGDHQLGAGWSHPLGEHTAVVRRREFGQPAVGGAHLVGASAARARRHRARTCAARPAELSFSATSPPSSSSAATASSSPDTTRPLGTAIPCAASSSLASCSASHRPSAARRTRSGRARQSLSSDRDRRRRAALGGAANPGAQPGRGGDAGASELPRGLVVEQLGQGR